MTIEKAIEFGKIFLKSIEDEKVSATYEFVETAVKMMEKEQKTGHWIDKFGGEYRCSCCREIISIDTEIEFPNGITYKYCPRCGCRIEGSDEK